MQEPARADAQLSQQRILHAACALIDADGDFSMTDLGATAGLSRMTVYRHFADRNAVLDALILTETQRLREAVVELHSTGDLAEAMAVFADAVTQLGEDHRLLLLTAAGRVEHVARATLSDEFVTTIMAERRAAGDHDSPLSDAWLAACMRALSMAAIFSERPRDEVSADLLAGLLQLLGLPQR